MEPRSPRRQIVRTVWKWSKRLAVCLLGVLLLAAAYGATSQYFATRSLERDHPAAGRLFDVGGYRLHLHSQGSGGVPVILDAGLTGASYDWEKVAAGVAAFSRVCTYDRAGYGWSDSGPLPRTSQQAVAELRTLLRVAKIDPPFIMVGHSWAGLNARLYASQHPDEVAGLVLVDAVNTDLLAEDASLGQVSTLFQFLNLTACLGTPQSTVRSIINEPKNDEPALEFRRRMLSRTKSAHVIYDELTGQLNWRSVRSAMKPLGGKPVVVISQLIEPQDCVGDAGAGFLLWQKDQEALMGISTKCTRIIATQRGHNIQFTEPGLIVESIRQMVGSVRSAGGAGN